MNKKEVTPREGEVLSWLREGLSAKQIAFKMGVTKGTIEKHKHNLFKKFQVKNSIQLLKTTQNHK